MDRLLKDLELNNFEVFPESWEDFRRIVDEELKDIRECIFAKFNQFNDLMEVSGLETYTQVPHDRVASISLRVEIITMLENILTLINRELRLMRFIIDFDQDLRESTGVGPL